MKDRDDADIIRVHRGLHYPQDICKGCQGMGIKAYGNTSTWRHTIGGSAITHDVCEHCWGSGSASRPWPSWREREQREAETAARIAAMEEDREAAQGAHMAVVTAYQPHVAQLQARIAELEGALRDLTREVWSRRPSGKRWAQGMPVYEAYHTACDALAGRGAGGAAADARNEAEALRGQVLELIDALKECLLADERRASAGQRSDLVCGAIEVAVLYGGGLAALDPEQVRLHNALAVLTGASAGVYVEQPPPAGEPERGAGGDDDAR